jgi:dipeptidase E
MPGTTSPPAGFEVKLFLQSYRTTGELGRLLAMAGGPGARMAVLENALDNIGEDDRLAYSRTAFDILGHFSAAGFEPEPLDLRDYFGRTAELARTLAGFEAIYAGGGNAFVLRRAMELSGFDAVLPALLERGIVYGGYSAGACVAGDDLEVLEGVDDPQAVGIGHPPGPPVYRGLGLVPFAVLPHFRSDHAESEQVEHCVERARREGLPHRCLRDGETIVVEGARLEIIGLPEGT